jgi:glycosyltransferase involved in cell wall biosynthesis
MRILYLNDVVADRDTHVTSRLEIARALERLGHEVECLLFFERDKPRIGGLPLARFVSRKTGGWYSPLLVLWYGLAALRSSRADIVLYEPSFWPVVVLRRFFGFGRPRMVMDVRSAPVDVEERLKGRLRRLRYRLAVFTAVKFMDGLTVITPALRGQLCAETRSDNEKVGVWSSAVDSRLFRAERIAGAGAGNGANLCIAYHGVLSPTRGLQQVIPAIGILKDEGVRVECLFIGDGPARFELEKLAEKHGVKDLVEFTGKVSHRDIPSLLDRCDLGIIPLPDYPGWRVSSPLKLMEYCAMGRPVIASRIEAHENVLGESPGVFYLKDVSADSVAEALRSAHARRGDLGRFGDVNRSIVVERFDWDTQGRCLEKYLLGLLNHNDS